MRVLPFLLLPFVLMVHSSSGQELVVSPNGTQVKNLHSNIFFLCELRGVSRDAPVTVEWQGRNGQSITSQSGRIHVESGGPTTLRLYIRNTTHQDAGIYTCRAEYNSQVLTQQVEVSLYEDIAFASTPDVVEHIQGSSPLLQCSATGQPTPVISWRFNLRGIYKDDPKYSYEERGLRIHSIDSRDNGTYTCRAEVRSHGSVKVKHITLNVLYAPIISHAIEVSPMIVGRRAVLTCEGSGNPPVQYEWYREQQADKWVRAKVKIGQGSRQYVIEEVSENDGGRYFCKVSNRLNSSEIYTDVVISVTPSVSLRPAINALEGNTFMIECIAEGKPVPSITWRKTGSDEEYVDGVQPDDDRITVENTQLKKSKLIIQGVTREDSGQYTCTAENPVGTDEEVSQLTVEYKPSVYGEVSDASGWGGQVVNFTCSATGLPLPTINWLHANRVISNNDVYTISSSTVDNEVISTLVISINRQEWVYGDYECGAKSRHGYVKHEISLRQIFTPEAPTVRVESEDTTSVVLSASLPRDDGGMPVTKWRVEYKPADKELQDEIGITSSEFTNNETLAINGLRPDTPYIFFVSAGNVVGYGEELRFRIKTEFIQQDVPSEPLGTTEAPVGKKSNQTLSAHDEIKGSRPKQENEPAAVEKSTGSETAAPPVAIIIGGVVAVAVLIVIIVGIVMYKRKSRKRADTMMYGYAKRRAAEQNGSLVTVNEAKDVDNIQLEIRKANVLPDLVHHKNTNSNAKSPHDSRKTSIATVASPLPGRVANEKLVQSVMNGGVSQSSIQQQAWTQMMKVALTSDDELEDDDEEEEVRRHLRSPQPQRTAPALPMDPSPIMELPPPPDFLLEQEGSRAPEVDHDSYQDILDGYYSGDNVEEEEDYVNIRVPHHRS